VTPIPSLRLEPRKVAVAIAGFCAFLNLYSPQALLPALAREFGVGAAEISTIMTASALAIALTAPFTGAIADVLGRKRVITAAMLAVVVPMAGAALARDVGELIAWRFAQGLLLPPIFAVTVAYIGDEWPPAQVAGVRVARFACYFAFAGVLLVLAFIDLDTRLLPDVITLPAIPILYLAAFSTHTAGWLERLIGAAAGYLVFRLIADFYYHVLKREGLGLGDGKLLAIVGAVLGWKALPFVVFVASFVGPLVSVPAALLSRRRSATDQPLRRLQIAFGPFLAAAAVLYLFVAPWLEAWLEGG